jgi:anthranilate phosphoribosyltransferase
MAGGDPRENAAITRAILNGEDKGPKRNVVLINTAAALVAAGTVPDLKGGIDLATAVIDQGKALDKLEGLIEYTRANG